MCKVHLNVCSYHVTYAFQSESTLNFKELLARSRRKIYSLSDCNRTQIHSHLVHKRTLNHIANWANDWAVLRVLISTVHLTICSYHVTYVLERESSLYSCLNVKELLARSRGEIWSLSECNWTRTHNHLVHKETLNHLANWPNDWAALWVLICTVYLTACSYHVMYVFQSESTLCSCQSLKLQISYLLLARCSLTFRQL